MKVKRIFIAACLVVAAPIASLAASGNTPSGVTSGAFTWGGNVTFNPSTNVSWEYVGAAQAFSAVTKHLNGTKKYATGSNTTSIWSASAEAGVALTSQSLASDFSGDTGWSAQ